ncbi:MAG: putative sulfate exporter family transporter [Bdellovibrionales bacterium]|nr:putative sulfate exporter family transporter [Bdellovibrionales bacterium]
MWTLFLCLGACVSLSPWASPPIALALGILWALLGNQSLPPVAKRWTRLLLQGCVVLLGFGMDFVETVQIGAAGLFGTTLSITATLVVGHYFGRLLRLSARQAVLVSAGTAICGGSAIAALGSALESEDADMSVALATVFVLNAIALIVFPFIGHVLSLTPEQFGTWAGIAVHDVSSVVGAASAFHPDALGIATAVKLSRTLWIAPMVLAIVWCFRRRDSRAENGRTAPLRVPLFIVLFLVASALRSAVEPIAAIAPTIVSVARSGLALTLFLIGAGLSRQTLRAVGVRPLLHGTVLWLVVSVASLLMITGVAHVAEAETRCRRQGWPLHELVASSDAIATVHFERPFQRVKGYGRDHVGIAFSFQDMMKAPVTGAIPKGARQVLYLEDPKLHELLVAKEFLVFLQRRGEDEWRANECQYFEITPGGLVRDVCEAISDLFGENRFERERRCLLNLVPAAPLLDVKNEIRGALQSNKEFSGWGRVVRDLRWQQNSPYQAVLFEPDPRRKQEFFGTKLARRTVAVRAYVRSGTYERRELEQLVREGRRIEFHGYWEGGNFLIGSLK